MSDPVRIGFIVEGPTDFVVLEAIVARLLAGREYEAISLQPTLSVALAPLNGGGWTAVYLWCRQTIELSGGTIQNNPLFDFYDIVVMQVDADVATKRYTDDQRIVHPPDDLPFSEPCPPVSATTDRLRRVMLGWIGESAVPPRLVLCTPSSSLETWILVGLFPADKVASKADLECRRNIEAQLQSKPLSKRLVRSGQKDIEKYRGHAPAIAEAWTVIRSRCTEAERFSSEFSECIPRR